MDSITQAALGAVIGELTLGKKLGWRGAAWGAFFGTLPDLDVVAMPFLSEAARITWHRGLSHSLLLCFLAPILLAWPLAHLHRRRELKYPRAFVFLFLTWFTHVLIDCFTTYGTQIFEPFSDQRIAFDNIYIIDLFFTLPLLLSLGLIFFFAPKSKKRRHLNAALLTLSCLYVILGFGMKSWATRNIRSQMREAIPGAHLIATTPTFSNIILWRGLVETPDALWVTYWSPFDEGACRFDHYSKKNNLLPAEPRDPLLVNLIWFTRGHHVVRQNNLGHPVLIDMRFNEIHDPAQQSLVPVFQWHLEPDENGKTRHAPHLRPKGLDFAAALELTFSRLLGRREKREKIPARLRIAKSQK